MQKFVEIQNEVIMKYRIDLCDGTKCKNDWGRTHAHVKERRICKWRQANSIQSTFDLFHEIGHIETTKSGMRRAEEEYFATVWAIEEAKKYNLDIPQKIIDGYQEYIDMEKERGIRRGGKAYGELKLSYEAKPIKTDNALKQYNDLMNRICRENLTIGTKFSVGTEKWNLRDMVSEVQYTLDIYEDPGCLYWQDAHDPTQHYSMPWLKEWRNDIARMKRFISKYKDAAMAMECVDRHVSMYD